MTHAPEQKGFTLVETLVAITILTLAVVAPFEAIQNVTNAARLTKEKLIASELAQEALEYERFIAYNNYLASPTSYDGIKGMDGTSGPNCQSPNLCTVDPSAAVGSAFALCSGTCSPLQLNTTTGLYTQSNIGNPTIYTRTFTISGRTVTVTVSWYDRGANSIVFTEDTYDWL
jgi:prepilin-type N-terminal cleavage/methylation domain-containing protein